MNKRIKKLAEKAGLRHMPSTCADMADLYKCADFQLEDFAELIIRKCADIVNDLNEDHTLPGDCDTAVYIKRYFGVE